MQILQPPTHTEVPEYLAVACFSSSNYNFWCSDMAKWEPPNTNKIHPVKWRVKDYFYFKRLLLSVVAFALHQFHLSELWPLNSQSSVLWADRKQVGGHLDCLIACWIFLARKIGWIYLWICWILALPTCLCWALEQGPWLSLNCSRDSVLWLTFCVKSFCQCFNMQVTTYRVCKASLYI